MNKFSNSAWDACELAQMPGVYQENGDKINSCLRKYIFDGEPCEYDETLRAALKKYTRNDRIKNYLVMIMLSMFMAVIAADRIQSGKEPSILMFVILSVYVLIICIFVCREITNNIAVRAADKGEVQCFRYTFYGKLYYETDPDEGSRTFYADLGEFLVKLPCNTDIPSRPFGLVINIKGTEHFYLLV
ncbi:MAG: hypothetical protein MSJ26_01985 [Oscillospiraceae bacterium]|nr:hypothetical protein [Oscillospiraceae bacterium]